MIEGTWKGSQNYDLVTLCDWEDVRTLHSKLCCLPKIWGQDTWNESVFIYRKRGKIHWAKLLCFSWFSELRKFFHEYKHLSLIVLHLWPKQHESISVKTSMVLKLWIFSLVNPSLSMVLGLLGRVIKKLATSWIMPSLALLLHMVLSMTACSYVYD